MTLIKHGLIITILCLGLVTIDIAPGRTLDSVVHCLNFEVD